jgi:hypothetical protein
MGVANEMKEKMMNQAFVIVIHNYFTKMCELLRLEILVARFWTQVLCISRCDAKWNDFGDTSVYSPDGVN